MNIYGTISVVFGYFALNYLWPRILFAKYLANKQAFFKLFFCLSTMFIITNLLVLSLGLINCLNWIPVFIFFYGALLVSVIWKFHKLKFDFFILLNLIKKSTYDKFITWINSYFQKGIKIKTLINLICYLLIGIIIISISINIIVFSTNWNPSLIFNDTQIHLSWIQALKEGKIFSEGIYPFAMHSNIYTISVLFGVPISFSWKILCGINVLLFLIALLWFLRTIFKHAISICFVYALLFFFELVLFNLNIKFSNTSEGVYRFLWNLPEEYGLWSIFSAAVAMFNIFKIKLEKNKNLKNNPTALSWFLLLSLSVACAFSTHFYTLFILIIICASIFICNLNKLNLTKFKYIFVSGIIPILICSIPMVLAITLHYELSDSLKWGSAQIINEEMDNRNLEEIEKQKEQYNIQKPILLDATITYPDGETNSLLDNSINIGYNKLCPNNTAWLFILLSSLGFIAYLSTLFFSKKAFQKYSPLFISNLILIALFLLNLYDVWSVIEYNRLIPILYPLLFAFMAITIDSTLSKPWIKN